MKRRNELIRILLLSLLIGAAAVVCSELGALTHLSNREGYTAEAEVKSVMLTGTGKAEIFFSDASPEETGRFIHRLRVDLYQRDSYPIRLNITVRTKQDKNAETVSALCMTDVNPVYVETEILKIDLEHVVSVELETRDHTPFSVGVVAVDNSFYLNLYLFAFAALAAFALLFGIRWILLAAFERERPGKETGIRRFFTVSALCLGGMLVVCLPAQKVGCDEDTHLQAVLKLASFPSDELHLSDALMFQITVTEFNNPEAQPGGGQEQDELDQKLTEEVDYKLGRKTPEFENLWNRNPAYFVMAVFMKGGKGMNLSWPAVLRLTRAGNLLMYVALIWLALKMLPCGHLLMALIALFPQSIFLASTVSYDPFVTGCLYVGMAFALRLLLGEQRGWKFRRDFILMLLFFILGCLPKAVYAPLMLIALLIPFRRTQSRKLRIASGVALLAAAVVTLAVFILPTLTDPSASGDIRGGAVSEQSQLAFISQDPLNYIGILLSQMFRWLPQCCFGPDCTTFMGHLVNGTAGYQGSVIPVLVLLAAAVLAGIFTAVFKKRQPVLKWQERIWILSQCLLVTGLIWTAMYVAFTEPGSTEIAGVQGRYFLPVLFPLYFALGAELPAGRLLVWKEDLWYYIMLFGMTAAGAAQIFCAVVLRCAL